MTGAPVAGQDRAVVLAHDWLTGMRGGERVLELLCTAFPRASIATLLHRRGSVSDVIEARPVHTSFLDRLPRVHRYYRYLLPVMPAAAERMRLPEAEWMISTSHCVAKGFPPPPGARHLCYCFTPMRYAWTFHEEYFGSNRLKRRTLDRMLLRRLRDWDRRVSDRVDRFVTLSRHVRERIRRFYDRDADVVYPPVNTDFFSPGVMPSDAGDYDLVVSALVPYKRVDLAVQAYRRLGHPLKIAGIGTEATRLRRMAGPATTFLGWQSDEELRNLYRGCRCLIFPGEEDFGIVPVEAQACGRPVVALARGGVLETVDPGTTGVLFAEQTVEALIGAVEQCAAMPWKRDVIRGHALQFREEAFLDGLARVLDGMDVHAGGGCEGDTKER